MVEELNAEEQSIGFVELLRVLWEGKWKIAISCLVFLALGVLAALVLKDRFVASTEFKPITSFEADRYRASNHAGILEISPGLLENLFFEQLNTLEPFVEGFQKFDVLDRSDYANDDEFNVALIELASSVSILPPVNADNSKRGESRRFWKIVFAYSDKEKWRNVLKFVVDGANEDVRQILVERFDTLLKIAELQQKNSVEDLDTRISNILTDYEVTTTARLEFLKEQAQIARTLDVGKSTLNIQTFDAQNSVVANVNAERPFYLRGFEAIEKEIDLIESRNDKRVFVNGLLEVEQQKRAILQNKSVERASLSMNLTPIVTNNGFTAIQVLIDSTNFNYQFKPIVMILGSFVLGLVAGSLIVILGYLFEGRSQKEAAVWQPVGGSDLQLPVKEDTVSGQLSRQSVQKLQI